MPLKLYNFLTHTVEVFQPLNPPNVSLYTCGPTVYDFVHIGNLRTYIFEDLLRRVLEAFGYNVRHVANITDIDDKIIKGMKEKGMGLSQFTKLYEKAFLKDLKKLNIKKAHFYPRATDNIKEMIDLIGRLVEKGFAYKTEDGVYFNISKFGNYGKLAGIAKKDLKPGARVAVDEYDKEHPSDFALWKFSLASAGDGQGRIQEPLWDSPWGKGRPGWHIECSAMSQKFLGETIDIHCGAVDLLFPHHENEIAQSESATGKTFVRFWLEGEHLLVSGQKMAKSLGNIITLDDLQKKGFDPLAFRYLCLTTHYRAKLNFTWDSLKSAQNALNNLRFEVANMDDGKEGKIDIEMEKRFMEAVSDDLGIPEGLAVLWRTVRSHLDSWDKKATLLRFDQVLGLGLDKVSPAKLSQRAKVLIKKREQLRKQGRWSEADKIRQELAKMGVEVEDTKTGPVAKIKVKGK